MCIFSSKLVLLALTITGVWIEFFYGDIIELIVRYKQNVPYEKIHFKKTVKIRKCEIDIFNFLSIVRWKMRQIKSYRSSALGFGYWILFTVKGKTIITSENGSLELLFQLTHTHTHILCFSHSLTHSYTYSWHLI